MPAPRTTSRARRSSRATSAGLLRLLRQRRPLDAAYRKDWRERVEAATKRFDTVQRSEASAAVRAAVAEIMEHVEPHLPLSTRAETLQRVACLAFPIKDLLGAARDARERGAVTDAAAAHAAARFAVDWALAATHPFRWTECDVRGPRAALMEQLADLVEGSGQARLTAVLSALAAHDAPGERAESWRQTDAERAVAAGGPRLLQAPPNSPPHPQPQPATAGAAAVAPAAAAA